MATLKPTTASHWHFRQATKGLKTTPAAQQAQGEPDDFYAGAANVLEVG